jgi:hypothetical protein
VIRKAYALGLITLLSGICLTSIASAQSSWWRTFGGSWPDVGHSAQQTADSGYIIAGLTESFGVGAPGTGNVYLIKADSEGETLWTRIYGGAGYDEGHSVQRTTDGGYIIAGYTSSYGAGSDDVYLIKTDASGDTLWTRTYGGLYADEGYSVQQTTDSGYIISGSTASFGAGEYDVYLVKTNASGDTLWTRTYGGPHDDVGNSVQQTAEGGYIIAGFTYSFGAGIPDHANVYLIKTSASGDTLWTRAYGEAHEDEGHSVQQTADSGYIITGLTVSPFSVGDSNVYLIKTNVLGDTLWTRAYGGPSYDVGNSVQRTTDDGYIVTGLTSSYGAGWYDVYLIKTNASGDTLWTVTYGGTNKDGGSSVLQTADGGYFIAGWTASFGAGSYDVYLIKTDADGVGIGEPLTRHPARPTRSLVQPNPFTSSARVPGHEADVFVLSDVTGRQVAVCKGDRIGVGLLPGVYFLSPVGTRAGKSATATIVKTAF